jgi:hypothetical protein
METQLSLSLRFALLFLFSVFLWPSAATAQGQALKVEADWNAVPFRTSKTTTTLQVVVNPPLRPGSAIHDAAWQSLRTLQADYVRFVPWLPYPRLAVAELEPPTAQHTSWDFSLIDPLVSDFFNATDGHPIMLNFSTIPQWMCLTDKPVPYPANPDEVTWNYEQGTDLRDPTAKEVADYYARLASWYSQGGFTDENGKFHSSPFHYKIALWEVLNEVDAEHSFTPQTYTKVYDAIVSSVRKVLPDTQFVALALAAPSDHPDFFEYFLNPQNHQPGIPLDYISYHFYASPAPSQPPESWQYTFFDQADRFLASVRFIQAIRQRISPSTRTAINELGAILPGDPEGKENIPDTYWNLCGALYAYLFVELANQGIDLVGSSQIVGYPTQFPSVTMLDWRTGQPNARYRVLQLLRENFGPGDRLVKTSDPSADLLAQAFVSRDDRRKLLLVNKRAHPLTVAIAGAIGARESHVDTSTASASPVSNSLSSDNLTLGPFSVTVVTFQRH